MDKRIACCFSRPEASERNLNAIPPTAMPITANTVTQYPIDPEHNSLRFAIFGIFIATWFIATLIAGALIASEGFNLIAVGVGFGVAYLATTLGEKYLRKVWTSGRMLEVSREGVSLYRKDTAELAYRASDDVSLILWRFQITKRTRVPKGHWMYACALENGEKHITVYALLTPTQAEQFARNEQFKQLFGKKDKKAETAAPSLRLAGEDRKLRDAESYRWLNGGEIHPHQFTQYLDQLHEYFPEWLPIRS
jgi:hypothetical protein